MKLDDLRLRINEAVGKCLKKYSTSISSKRLDEKLFRDPIFGFQRIRPYEVLIIDSPLFQRLRGIFQTSVAYLTYPSSIHSRFEHSINCSHLSEQVLNALVEKNREIDPVDRAEVRLAALLHDIGHCIFSHTSEVYYQDFPEFSGLRNDDSFFGAKPSAGEIINYCILTCDSFKSLLWDPILKVSSGTFFETVLDDVNLKRVAEMVVGASPDDDKMKKYLTDIINGPFDVDKLDYLRRDSYFTGIDLSVDVERLLTSVDVQEVDGSKRLVINYRGMVVVEQLLFARMALYDCVYHHHKVRAATVELLQTLRKYGSKRIWPTSNKTLNSIVDLLEIDEYIFFGNPYDDADLSSRIKKLRDRELLKRALVLLPRSIKDGPSHTRIMDVSNNAIDDSPLARRDFDSFVKEFSERTVQILRDKFQKNIYEGDILIDFPKTPNYSKLGNDTIIQMTPEYAIPLWDLFPFEKVVNNYSTQYKYRSYLFAPENLSTYVACAGYLAFQTFGIELNDLSFILAHQDIKGRELLHAVGVQIPDWREHYFAPDK